MPLLLVRHAAALRRRDWSKPDHLRPLTPKGTSQAEGLVELLRPFGVRRILSSPFVRCVETVEPLALALGLPVEPVADLAEGAGRSALRILADLDGTAVLCSHGDVLPQLVEALAPSARIDECEKGSTWLVDLDAHAATYLPPPSAP
jgi:8-oxo-dGTP diphosphatase